MTLRIPMWFWKSFVLTCLGLGAWWVQANYASNEADKKEHRAKQQQLNTQDSLFNVMVLDSIRAYHWHFKHIENKLPK